MSTALRAAVSRPVFRRLSRYGAGSLVAAPLGEMCFAAVYGWGHAGTTWASAAGFLGAVVPNYLLNRRWAWSDRRGRERRTEIFLYALVALSSFAAAALATHFADTAAHHLTTDQGWRVALVAAAYLGVAAVFFLVKFAFFELIVFTAEPAPAQPTTS